MAKKNFTRIMCLVLVALMMLSFGVSCAETSEQGETSDTTNVAVTSGDVTPETDDQNLDAEGYFKDQLSDDINYNGAAVRILAWSDVEHPEFEVESDSADITEQALYRRIIDVEERLGVDLQFIYTDGDAGEIANWKQRITSAINDEHDVDITAAYSLAGASAANDGLLYNLRNETCKAINLDNPWWPSRLVTEATVKNRLYFVSGDISNNALYMMYTCFFNTTMLNDLGLENPQDLVPTKEWTYDKFIELCEGVYSDENGDGLKNADNTGGGDRFGYMTSSLHSDVWFYGSGALIVEKNAAGEMIPSTSYGGDKVISSLTKINNLLYNTSDGFFASAAWHQKNFRDEKLLFCIDRARIAFKVLQANESLKYGIVPSPKYDVEQESYVTVMGNPFTLYSMVSNVANPEMCATVLEALASKSYRTLTPAVFEISFKLRYSKDSVSSQMFDVIRENLTFDIGRIFSDALIGQGAFRNAVANNTAAAWKRTAESNMKVLEKALERLQTNLDKSGGQ